MNAARACEAVANSTALVVEYQGFRRIIEVHAVGRGANGQGLMRVFQVAGGSKSGTLGWKLFHTEEATLVGIAPDPSCAPRSGFNPADPAMTEVFCRV